MINQYINQVVNNNLLLSGVAGLICSLLYYLENKRNKTIVPYISYLKLVILVSLAIYGVLYLKNYNTLIKESSVKIGEPDF